VGKTLPCEIIIPPRGKNIPSRGIKIPADGIFLESFVRTVIVSQALLAGSYQELAAVNDTSS
jgi:hypothetical protein